jgi:type I restriction enzyme S subunit
MSTTHWRRVKLKYLAALKSGDAIEGKDIKDDGDYPVYGGNGLRGYTNRFTHEGERVLIGRQGALCGNINYAKGKFWATEHAIVATPKQDFNATWLGEALRAMNLNQYTQSAAQPGIAVEVIENLEVLVPPRAEQDQIAQRLLAKLSQVDGLVKAKQRLLDLLTEKRRALIASAVTKGLNPAAPMRDSGIEWLGLVPMHWRSERARWLFGESRLDIRTQDQMVTCFRDGMVTLRSKRREDGFTNGEIEHGYQGIRQGQLVLHSMDAFAGAIGVSDSDGKCTPEYVICDPLTGETDAHYFALLLREMALRRYIQAHCSAVRERAPRIRFNEFKDFVLPLPPLDEQHAIVAYIERQALPLLRLAEHTRTTLDLLKERRTALIAAAVSGDAATPNNQMEEDISHAS